LAVINFGPFSGINQSVAPEYIKSGEAASAENVECRDGVLKTFPGSVVAAGFQSINIGGDEPALKVEWIKNVFPLQGNIWNTKSLLAHVVNRDDRRSYILWRWNLSSGGWHVAWRQDDGFDPATGLYSEQDFFDFAFYQDEGQPAVILCGTKYIVLRQASQAGFSATEYPLPSSIEVSAGREVTAVVSRKDRIFISHGNSVYYSHPFSCTDFSIGSTPGAGGGEIKLPEEGGGILSMRDYNDSLVIIRQNGIYVLYGSTPTSFETARLPVNIQPMSGRNGVVCEGLMYIAAKTGIAYFDGVKAELIPANFRLKRFWDDMSATSEPKIELLEKTMARRSRDAIFLFDNRLYMPCQQSRRLPVGDVVFMDMENYMVVFDIRRQEFEVLHAKTLNAQSIFAFDDEIFTGTRQKLHYVPGPYKPVITSSEVIMPPHISILGEPEGEGFFERGWEKQIEVKAAWESGIIGAGSGNIVKTQEKIRLFGRCVAAQGGAGRLFVTLRTWQGKLKEKTRATEIGAYNREKILDIPGRGKRFQLVISNKGGGVFELSSIQVQTGEAED
jgi:hypothetical protein